MQIDMISLLCIIAVSLTAAYTYTYRQGQSNEMKKIQKEAEEIATNYEALTKEVKTVAEAKVDNLDGTKFLKIFAFLNESWLEKFELTEDKKTWKYSIEVMEMETESLMTLIDKGINDKIVSMDTKKSFMIMKPGLATAKIIFN